MTLEIYLLLICLKSDLVKSSDKPDTLHVVKENYRRKTLAILGEILPQTIVDKYIQYNDTHPSNIKHDDACKMFIELLRIPIVSEQILEYVIAGGLVMLDIILDSNTNIPINTTTSKHREGFSIIVDRRNLMSFPPGKQYAHDPYNAMIHLSRGFDEVMNLDINDNVYDTILEFILFIMDVMYSYIRMGSFVGKQIRPSLGI
jgi:hypothetical protein